ncbi:MAG: hypothetical protein M0Z51_16610 [Propionibacterium sp.]|nr:hypothetical protein [Propionibacterium sp.]
MTRRPRDSRADVIEDVTDLVSFGVTEPHAIATRMDMTLTAIARACYRAGRADLGRRFSSADKRDRHALRKAAL